jgi:DNA-binding CsgD family transcriptional regulator
MLRQTLEIKDRILEIHEGQSSFEEKHEKMTGVIEDLSRIVSNGNETLTRREQQIADLCCEGLISKEIADRLGLSTRTVETHKNNIFRKLGIHTTEELIQRMKKQ